MLLPLFVGLFSSWAAGAPRETFAGVDDRWQRYSSPHFELFSHAGDSESRTLLRRLELLHAVFGDLVRLREQRPNLVSIYLFDREKTFRAYTPEPMRQRERLAGFYLNRPDRSVIVVAPTSDEAWSQRLIFHEYVHHLTRVNGDDPALWYTEGIAEYFSTITEHGKFLSLGLPINEHVALLRSERLMSLDELFAVDHRSGSYNESERAGLFYAQSWALLHYWYRGVNWQAPEKQAARDRFLQRVRSEGDHGDYDSRRKLFAETIGADYAQTVSELLRYVRGGRYNWAKIATPSIAPMSTYTAAPVPRDEIRRRLAELDLRVNRAPAAKLEMLNAATQTPVDLRALEILGTDAMIDGDPDVAKQRWSQAVDAGTTNPGVIHQLAELEARQWFSRLDISFQLPEATAERLRTLLFQSLDVAPNQTQAYEMLAWVEASVRKPSAKNINLVQSHLGSLRPRSRTLLALALLRIRLGDFPTARAMLDQADAEAAAPQERNWSQTLRHDIARRETEGVSEIP